MTKRSLRPRQRLSLLLALTLVGVALCPAVVFADPGETPALETPLNPGGEAFELHLDPQGGLWISEYGAGEIWHVNPAADAAVIYGGLVGASDAQMDASGQVWWTNPEGVLLGRLSPSTGAITLWTLEDAEAYSLLGLAFDAAGNVWLTNSFDARFHRFAPATSELCTWESPTLGASDYVTTWGGAVWFGDWRNGAIVRFEPEFGRLTWWTIAGEDPRPTGLAFDRSGRLWWADSGLGSVVRLDPGRMVQTTYTLPGGGLPASIAVSPYDWVWYAGPDGNLGVIDPLSAPGNAQTVARQTYHAALKATCIVLQPTTAQATVESATVDWGPLTLASSEEEGWMRYALPRSATLRGIAASEDTTWVIDSLTQRLIEIPVTAQGRYRLNVPLVLKGRAS